MNRTQEIKDGLRDLEAREDIKIIYAIESGSRAWGFESTDSDWDVRFIYVRNPKVYMSCIGKPRDTITLPIDDDLDFHGWDITKTLSLFYSQNPCLMEWLQSDIVYIEPNEAIKWLQDNLKSKFSPRAAIYHYIHMAQGHVDKYLSQDQVKMKRYMYAIRPLMCCRWIWEHNEPAPMNIEDLYPVVSGDAGKAIRDLIEFKKSGVELGLVSKVGILDDYISSELKFFSESVSKADDNRNMGLLKEELNGLMYRTLVNEINL